MNEYLARKIELEEIRAAEEEEKEKYRLQKSLWKSQLVEKTLDDVIRCVLNFELADISKQSIITEYNEFKSRTKSNFINFLSQNLLHAVTSGESAKVCSLVHAQLLAEQRAKVEKIRQKRRIRLATIAARYWLREARHTIKRRASSKIMPNLGGENVFARLGKRRKHFDLGKMIDPDQLKRAWKERRENQLIKKKIIKFSAAKLVYQIAQNSLRPDADRLIMSVFVYYAEELTDYALEKFGPAQILHSSDFGVFYLDHGTSRPVEHFDHVVEMCKGTESCDRRKFVIDSSDETKNDFAVFCEKLYDPEVRYYHVKMTSAKLAEAVLYSHGQLSNLDALMNQWKRTNTPQDPSLLVLHVNHLIDQLLSRLSDLNARTYPEPVQSIKCGDMITPTQIEQISQLKLRNVNFDYSKDAEKVYASLNDYLDYSKLTSLPLRLQIKRLFYRKMNEHNWEETCHIPWFDIISRIVDYKISRLPQTDRSVFLTF